MKTLSDIIIKPLISEKSFSEAKEANKYTFVVAKSANKVDIRRAVEKLYGVKVLNVYTSIVKGSKVRNTRYGKKTDSLVEKKARVLLPSGQKIDIFEEKTS